MTAVIEEAPLVLVADDDVAACAMACAALEDAGFRVLEAYDGVAALDSWQRHQPELVLLDVEMPGLDGFAVCARIRGTPEGENVPIMIVTGFEDTASIDRAYEVGATDFVAKPVNWSLLGHRVRYVLRGAETNRTLAIAEAENRALLEALPDQIIVVDRNGIIEHHIRNVHEQRQQQPPALQPPAPELQQQPLHGAPLQAVLPIEVVSTCVAHVRDVLADGLTRSFEYPEQPDGTNARHFELRFLAHGDRQVLVIQRDVSERKAAEARIHRLAYYDALTGLGNRHLFVEHLAAALDAARHASSQVAVFYIDLDQFKRINDSLGLRGGDAVLLAVARRLSDAVQAIAQDSLARGAPAALTLARLAADEFALLLAPVTSAAAIAAAVARLRAALDRPLPGIVGTERGQELAITQSIGVAVYPDHGTDSATLLRNADTAMQKAKEAGRAGERIYSPGMNARAAERLQLEGELRRALGSDELSLHFQPKFDIRTLRLHSAECLLRWTHPRRGSISPAQFIPIAEESGLIAQVDQFVMAQACRYLREWQRAGLAVVPLALNLSGREFWDPHFARGLRAAVDAAGISPDLLELEITEGVLMRDIELAQRALRTLKADGFSLAIDDFGTGFSSLAYLKQFPLDWLKIDRSFVNDVEHDPENQAICAAIIAMSHRLGLRVVAEGIETAAQLAFLEREGCDVAQGYLLGRPQPASAFVAVLATAGGMPLQQAWSELHGHANALIGPQAG